VLYQDKELLAAIGQAVMGGVFIFQGLKNARNPGMVLGRIEICNFRIPKVFLWIGLLMMFTGGALVLFDYQARAGALVLFIFTLLATAIFQRWWTLDDPVRRPYDFLMFF